MQLEDKVYHSVSIEAELDGKSIEKSATCLEHAKIN